VPGGRRGAHERIRVVPRPFRTEPCALGGFVEPAQHDEHGGEREVRLGRLRVLLDQSAQHGERLLAEACLVQRVRAVELGLHGSESRTW
jgi:hypothetical protein